MGGYGHEPAFEETAAPIAFRERFRDDGSKGDLPCRSVPQPEKSSHSSRFDILNIQLSLHAC